MDNDVRQAHQEAFDYIILALGLIGLAGGAVAFLMAGPASLWFLRSIALVAVVLIAFVLRRAGQFVVAAYVLVLELIGLVAGAFLQANTFTGFVPYLFIPVIIIASLLLSSPATVAMTVLAIAVVLVIVSVTGQLTLTNFVALVPPFILLLLTTLLATLGERYVAKVDKHLLDSKKLLRERTLELLHVLEDAQELQTQVENLKEEIVKARSETHRAHQVAVLKDTQLSGLIEGTIRELKASVKKLEHAVEGVVETANGAAPPQLLPEAWQQIDRLSGLVIGLEEMVQLEHDDFHLELQPVDLAQLLRELIQTGRGLARHKNLELRCTVSEDLPPLLADPARLRQALLHLLSNAIKFTDQGVIEVQSELTGSELTIFISDTGMGMSNEELGKIFQSFSRGQNTTLKPYAGSGLGLPLSKRIIELHRGRLWATSVLGVGSTFCVALPFEADLEKTQLSLPAVSLPQHEPQTAPATQPVGPSQPAQPAAPLIKVSQRDIAEPVLSQTSVNFGPVARFSPIYISRFGLTLLSLLLLITGLVLALALINGLNLSEAQVAQATPVNAIVPKISTPAAIVLPTSTTPASATPTRTEPTSTATATDTPVESTKVLAEALPSSTPTPKATDTPTTTPTPPPSATPTATATPSPTVTPKITPTMPAGQAVATSTLTVVPAAAGLSSQPTRPMAINLQDYPLLAGLGFRAIPNSTLTTATSPAATSGLSWLRSGSGYQVLFSSDQTGGDRDLYLAASDGGQPVNLTHAAGDDVQPAVSPDGRRVAFSSGRSGNLDIYVMNVDGSNPVQLTSSRGFDEWPAWSPDGRQIAFVSERDGNVEIYTMNGDGTNQQRLTHNPADDWPAVWSPDGRYLLLASNREGHWNLYLLEIQSGNLTRLTNAPGDEREPAWSPDGRQIAFTYNNGSNWDIYTLPAPGGAPAEVSASQWAQVTATSKDERYPAWLP